MFVFGDVVDPHTDVLKLVEDIVRNQVIEMVRFDLLRMANLHGY